MMWQIVQASAHLNHSLPRWRLRLFGSVLTGDSSELVASVSLRGGGGRKDLVLHGRRDDGVILRVEARLTNGEAEISVGVFLNEEGANCDFRHIVSPIDFPPHHARAA